MEQELRPLGTDVRLAPIEQEHADAMFRWLSQPELAEALGTHRAITREGTAEWIARAAAEPAFRPLAILAGERHVGNVILDLIDPDLATARLSIYIGDPADRAAGIGEAALKLALDQAFGEMDLFKVWLIVHDRNAAAIGLYERCGFVTEGVLRGEFLLGGERVDALRMAAFANGRARP